MHVCVRSIHMYVKGVGAFICEQHSYACDGSGCIDVCVQGVGAHKGGGCMFRE